MYLFSSLYTQIGQTETWDWKWWLRNEWSHSKTKKNKPVETGRKVCQRRVIRRGSPTPGTHRGHRPSVVSGRNLDPVGMSTSTRLWQKVTPRLTCLRVPPHGCPSHLRTKMNSIRLVSSPLICQTINLDTHRHLNLHNVSGDTCLSCNPFVFLDIFPLRSEPLYSKTNLFMFGGRPLFNRYQRWDTPHSVTATLTEPRSWQVRTKNKNYDP